MRQSKAIHKPYVIKPPERTARLLTSIEEERHYVKENKLEKRFGAELDRLKTTLLNLPTGKNTLLILLKTEKDLGVLREKIEKALNNRVKRWSAGFYTMTGVKVVTYIGAYFRLIPQSSLQQHPSTYIVAGLFLLLVWIGYFYILEQSHWAFHATVIRPLAKKYPQIPLKLFSACFFNLVSFMPLTTAVRVFPEFINPNWDMFLVNMSHLVLTIFTSNTITAVVNGLALVPLVGWIWSKIKRTG